MSQVEVDKIIPQSGTTLTVGESGDTITIPSGATLNNQGTATGFGLTWQSVQTTGFTASAGNAYPCNTTSAGFTVTLPATPSAGNQVQVVDYAGTFDTNALVIDPNGEDIEGGTDNVKLTGEREGVILTYIDATQGWIATSGINEGTDALQPVSYSMDFLVIAGGAGGAGYFGGGGGGAGGYRTSTQTVNVGTTITVTVGDGSSGVANSPSQSTNGSNSSISGTGLTTITSAGGGGAGAGSSSPSSGKDGGSGGGGGGRRYDTDVPGGSGNTPSTAPSQGNNGGSGAANDIPNERGGGGGGGAGGVGGNASSNGGTSANGGNGGAGTASSITGSSVTRAGGGGGGGFAPGTPGSATGGGGAGVNSGTGNAGTVNTGGGGGGTGEAGTGSLGGAGGKGVVILSMLDANYSGTTTGSPTVATGVSGKTVLTFTGSGSYTA